MAVQAKRGGVRRERPSRPRVVYGVRRNGPPDPLVGSTLRVNIER